MAQKTRIFVYHLNHHDNKPSDVTKQSPKEREK